MRTAGMKLGDIVLFSTISFGFGAEKKVENEANWARHTSEFGQGPMRSRGSGLPSRKVIRCIESMGYGWLHSYIFHRTADEFQKPTTASLSVVLFCQMSWGTRHAAHTGRRNG